MTVTKANEDVHWIFLVSIWGVFFFLLYLVSLYHYPLFHILVEGLRVLVAYSILMFSWNSRNFQENQYFIFLGIVFSFVGALDLFHTLTYKGMMIFPEMSANPPTQLWIAARYVESISLVIAPIFLRRRLRLEYLFSIYLLVFILTMTSIFYLNIFPDCFIEEKGLTRFKKYSEYVISLFFVISALLHYFNRSFFEKRVGTLILYAIFLAIISEIAFTFYQSVYGGFNVAGHFFKLLSFYLIYKAVIEIGVTKPYHILLRDLNHSKEVLAASQNELDTIIKNIPDIVYRLDGDGKITFISKAIESYGYDAGQLKRTYFSELVHPDDREKARYRVGERRTGERRTDAFEVRLLRADGGNPEAFEFSAEGLYVSMPPNRDAFLGTQGIAKNITDRKQAEMEKNYRIKLQGVIEMAGAVCHELNSPMQTILGCADLISMKLDDPESVKNKLESLTREIERMSTITKKIMHITRYKTKPYTTGEAIIDIEKSSEKLS